MNIDVFENIKSRKLVLINLVNSLIALPFLLGYYLRAHESPAGLGIIEVGMLGVFLIGPLSFISSIAAIRMSENKSISVAIKANLMLFILTYLFTALLLVKGFDLIITFVTLFVYVVLLSIIGYALAMFISKYLVSKE
jgi:hypothetical protein